jgi:Glycosyl transferases group 1
VFKKKRINLIYKASIGRVTGLERDALILQDILKDSCSFNHYKVTERRLFKELNIPQHLLSRIRAYLKTRLKKFDVNIFLEKIRPELLHLAKLNVLIPNHEMFSEKSVSLLDGIDFVLCKTQHAYDIFSDITPNVKLLGFTAQDRILSSIQPNYSQFFHLAGKSGYRRGTKDILNFWKDNPHLPKITVVAHGIDISKYKSCSNIEVFGDYIEDCRVKQLQNQIGIHICLSEAEGFGHFIVEAMSSRACIVTTNAPPMNELISLERGYLVDVFKEQQVENYFYKKYFFDYEIFKATIHSLVSVPAKEKDYRGKCARSWYEENDKTFRENLLETLESIATQN